MSEELKPCPFCGSHKIDRQECLGDYWVTCLTCLASSHMECSEEIADRQWNTRASTEITALKDEVCRLKSRIKQLEAGEAIVALSSIYGEPTEPDIDSQRARIAALMVENNLLKKELEEFEKRSNNEIGRLSRENDAHKKELEIARGERNRAMHLLRTIMDNATIYEQEENGTRQWCPDLNIYLRGNVGMLVEITKDEKKRIDELLRVVP